MAREPPLGVPFPTFAILSGLVVAVVVCLAFHFYGPGRQSGANDALDYAAMGRNLARGEGYTTATLYPLQLSGEMGLVSLEDFDPRKVPNLHRPPLLPLFYSLAYRIVGESNLIFPVVSILSYLVLLTLVWRLQGGSALVLAALFPPLVRQIPAGLAEIPAAICCLASTYLLYKEPRKVSWLFTAGLLCGAGFLLKSYLLILLPAFAVFLLIENERRSRWSGVAMFTLGWLVISGPWLVRNWMVAGNAFFTLQAYCEISKGIPGFEAFRIHRGLEPISTWGFLWDHPKEIAAKSLSSLFVCAKSDFGANLLAAALGLFVWRRLRREGSEFQKLGRALALLLLLNAGIALLLAPINLEPRYLVPTLVPLFVLSIRGITRLTQGARGEKFSVSLLVVFILLNILGFARVETIPDRLADGPFLQARIPEDGLVLTDADSFVAWYADRPALWFPSDEAALDWVLEKLPVRAVYLQEGLASPHLATYASPQGTLEVLKAQFSAVESTPSGGIFLH